MMMLSYPHLPEPHRSFFTSDEAYAKATADYREHETRRRRRANIDIYFHAGLAVTVLGVVAFMLCMMVLAYLRAYPAI